MLPGTMADIRVIYGTLWAPFYNAGGPEDPNKVPFLRDSIVLPGIREDIIGF